ncbi:hypothetical protein WA016_03731 [Myxococcus stipitatus]
MTVSPEMPTLVPKPSKFWEKVPASFCWTPLVSPRRRKT